MTGTSVMVTKKNNPTPSSHGPWSRMGTMPGPWRPPMLLSVSPTTLPNHEGDRLSQDLVRGQKFCAEAASSCHNYAIGSISVGKFFGDCTHRDGSGHGNLMHAEAV